MTNDSFTWTAVPLPERDLAAIVLDLAAPLLEKLGPAPRVDEARRTIELAVTFWNASVLASKRWERPRTKALNELKRRMRDGDQAAAFAALTERWREHEHWLDPRLVESWTCDVDGAGEVRLVCTVGLPDGVRAVVQPPVEQRIAIGGTFLDAVQISAGNNTLLSFPAPRHRSVLAEGGTAIVHAMMPAALQLLADGRLPRIGQGPVEVAIGGRSLGPMVLAEVRCAGASHDLAVLVFRPAANPPTTATKAKRKRPAVT